jgi:small subunit ribosomal protein S20
MPKIKSAKKAIRQSARRQKMNLKRKDAIRENVRELKKALAANNVEEAKQILPRIYKALDKASRAKTIKKNKASRLKSRLTRQLNVKSKSASV